MENSQSGCINRDENAVRNMIKIVKHQITEKSRPLKYRRTTIKDVKKIKDVNEIKDNNPENKKRNNITIIGSSFVLALKWVQLGEEVELRSWNI